MTDRVREVTVDLDEEALRTQFHPDFSPIGWHWGHAVWQRERWLLRELKGAPALAPRFDELFDTFRSPKRARGRALPPRRELEAYELRVDGEIERLVREEPETGAFARLLHLAANHERQHAEIVLCVRLLGGLYRETAPPGDGLDAALSRPNDWIALPEGDFLLGSPRPDGRAESHEFDAEADLDAWDNEHAAHWVHVERFAMQRFCVSQDEWLGWMDAGGYTQRTGWCEAGWAWRVAHDITAPGHWERDSQGRWYERTLSGLAPVGGDRPVAHVSWYEAEAYARCHRARLPKEAEWEYAASLSPAASEERDDGPRHEAQGRPKRRFPWGQEFRPGRAELGRQRGLWSRRGAHPAGASASGIEDLCGGVWEWTSDWFLPYPEFAPGFYAAYSAPWFGQQHRVARGGSRLTAPQNARVTFRNWYEPHVRQPCLGVRLVRDA
jgi:iron(II)-dependent oxidoreductase